MKAESPGPSVGKLVPKMKYTARILYGIYMFLTVLQFIFLIAGKMPVFDAICTSAGTAGTGGFGIKNDSMASYSPYIQWVTTIFMMLFAINFNFYYFLLFRQFKKAFSMEEVKRFLFIIIATILIIFINIYNSFSNAFEALTHASFTVASISSSTGFATTDFGLWPATSQFIIIILMFVGACAGSTGGGIKLSRILVLIKTQIKELNSYIHPKSIKKIKMDDKPIEHDVVRSTNVYLVTFISILVTSVFIISFENKDFTTSFTASLATMNNIGPGLSGVGPSSNFSGFSVLSKWTFIFNMLAGRLELFPILILFHPTIWKDMMAQKRSRRRLKKLSKM